MVTAQVIFAYNIFKTVRGASARVQPAVA
jgi:hypothetical protein